MNVSDKANGIKRIQADPIFDVLFDEIKQEQINVFMSPASSSEERETAHNMVVAIGLILSKMDAMIAAEKMQNKRK